MAQIVVIAGGSGFIGKALTKHLISEGYEVRILSTSIEKSNFVWNPDAETIDQKVFDGVQHIINLSGANIGSKRWTKKRKMEILNSRIKSTEFLYKVISGLKDKPLTFISASAIGIYGTTTSEHIFTEEDPPAHDFIGEVCQKWEEAALKFKNLNIRTVIIRTSLVLSKDAEIYKKLSFLSKNYLGSIIGNGKQYIPWVHLDDLCRLYSEALNKNTYSGFYNICSPQHITNKEFIKALAKSLKRPILLPPIPKFLIKFILGEMAIIILEGSRISSLKSINEGFTYTHSHIFDI